ncbi:MAG: dual specificity protein phosphatase [Chloroflexota bacterium]
MTRTTPELPEIKNPEVELHKPQLPEAVVTKREPGALEYALHVLNQLRKQGLWFTLLEIIDQTVRRVSGAPTGHFTRITPQLHVGGQYSRKGWATLARRGVTAAVSMRGEYDDRGEGFLPPRYLHLPTVDNHAPTLDHLHQGIDFITDELERGGQVYIHCWEGVGRGPTMLAAYLVSSGLKPSEAWAKIRAVRPFIRPTVAQITKIDLLAAEYGRLNQPPLSEQLPTVSAGTVEAQVQAAAQQAAQNEAGA